MYSFQLIFLLNLSCYSFSQTNFVHLNLTSNRYFFKPNTEITSPETGKIHSWNSSVLVCVINSNQFSWMSGFTFRKINQRIYDQISYYNVYHFINNNHDYETEKVYFKDPADEFTLVKQYGLVNRFQFHIYSKPKFSGFIGLDLESYFYERSIQWRATSDPYFGSGYSNVQDLFADIESFGWKISSVSGSVFYRQAFYTNPDYSLNGLFSVGSTFYSDKKEYKYLSWIGFGLEVGFGHKRNNRKGKSQM